ncbi:MAG: Crp/Fnr family transcriptional regulator [Betaproteobacteria bacterium]|nr:Crp/Fnr family transcriptional regulator [Betaproteobacteria bacterium]
MNLRDAVLPLLKTVPYLGDLDPAVLQAIAIRCRSKVIPEGQLVFMEGDPCPDLCILDSGRVMFYRANAEGREQVLKVFDCPGDTFCIASAFSTGWHIVSARTATETRLLLLDMVTVNRLVSEHPSMGLKLVATAGEHMAQLVELAEDLALKTATGRLAKYLHDLAVAEGTAKGSGIRLSRDRLPEEELASLLGTVRVHVSRSLTNLVRAGAIEVDRGFIRIRDLAVLRRISQGK